MPGHPARWRRIDPEHAACGALDLRTTTLSRLAHRIGIVQLLSALLLATGCAARPNPVAPPAEGIQPPVRYLHIVRHGLHSGIVVRAADVPEGAWPARRDLTGAEYLEVGWGDRAYYQAPDPSLLLGLRALLWPTASALHMVAFSGPVQGNFPAAEIVTLKVSLRGLDRLVVAIAASHELDAAGRPIPLGPGLYGTSRFYASRDSFHLFATCNVWAATMLREAGLPVSPLLSQTSGGLFAQLRRHGTTVPVAP